MPSWYFYPRSPCGERRINPRHDMRGLAFLSTLSLRRATVAEGTADYDFLNFYPRSPCGERPPRRKKPRRRPRNFYPRSPCGERHHADNLRDRDLRFLSTLSLRRATISLLVLAPVCPYFYPRSPCGERPHSDRLRVRRKDISIHALLAESDPPP